MNKLTASCSYAIADLKRSMFSPFTRCLYVFLIGCIYSIQFFINIGRMSQRMAPGRKIEGMLTGWHRCYRLIWLMILFCLIVSFVSVNAGVTSLTHPIIVKMIIDDSILDLQ